MFFEVREALTAFQHCENYGGHWSDSKQGKEDSHPRGQSKTAWIRRGLPRLSGNPREPLSQEVGQGVTVALHRREFIHDVPNWNDSQTEEPECGIIVPVKFELHWLFCRDDQARHDGRRGESVRPENSNQHKPR